MKNVLLLTVSIFLTTIARADMVAQNPCMLNPSSNDCLLTGSGGSGGSGGFIPPVSSDPIQPITTGGSTGGGIVIPITSSVDWSPTCSAIHSQIYGNRPVLCPTNWVKDNNTCGCSPEGAPPMCVMCSPGVCGSTLSYECKNPQFASGVSCASLVCLNKTTTVALAFNKAKAVTFARFNSSAGLSHYGALICEINTGATDLTLANSLKDPDCRKIFRALAVAKDQGITVKETLGSLGISYEAVHLATPVYFNGQYTIKDTDIVKWNPNP